MTLRGAARAGGLLLLALPLGGCVAAAIPALAASGMIVRGAADEDAQGETQPPPRVEVAPEAAPAPAPAAAPSGETAGPGGSVPGAALASAPAALPAGGEAPAGANPYAAFYRHALEQAGRDPVNAPRKSALLASPGSLEPVTGDCAIRPPAVVVDLDPAANAVDIQAIAGNPPLAEVLDELRQRDVEVFWISRRTALDAGQLRAKLLESGLDPRGRDGLLLMRRADDRKELRRRELAETRCVVAIAGDTRSDFDELFDFLRNPAAAAPLEQMIDAGWFLTPPPAPATRD